MSYSIICDARAGESLGISILALVDRRLTKRQWWTSDNSSLILGYEKRGAAEFACRRLRRNHARIVSTADARRMIREQNNEIEHQTAMMDSEQGWDSHKSAF